MSEQAIFEADAKKTGPALPERFQNLTGILAIGHLIYYDQKLNQGYGFIRYESVKFATHVQT
jgi:hypothetical protein